MSRVVICHQPNSYGAAAQQASKGALGATIAYEASGTRKTANLDSALVKALARAHGWQRLLESGECASITELAAAEKIDRSYLCRVLRLPLLAPEIVEAMIGGRQAEGMTLPGLMKGFPVEWEDQVSDQSLTEPDRTPASHCGAARSRTATSQLKQTTP